MSRPVRSLSGDQCDLSADLSAIASATAEAWTARRRPQPAGRRRSPQPIVFFVTAKYNTQQAVFFLIPNGITFITQTPQRRDRIRARLAHAPSYGSIGISLNFPQQFARNFRPLGFETCIGKWPARSPIPIARIAIIAFLAVQIGMHPRAV